MPPPTIGASVHMCEALPPDMVIDNMILFQGKYVLPAAFHSEDEETRWSREASIFLLSQGHAGGHGIENAAGSAKLAKEKISIFPSASRMPSVVSWLGSKRRPF